MRTLLVVAAVVAVAFAEYEAEWSAWKAKYGKTYETEVEDLVRKQIWEENLAEVNKHNLGADLGLSTYRMGMNHLADLTNAEYRSMLLGYKGTVPTKPEEDDVFEESLGSNPSEVDWRTKGVVTSVKDQGQCGSCWSFSAAASLESACALKYGTSTLTSLSEQQLVSCDTNDDGCDGGLYTSAWKYLESYGGQDTYDDYGYTSGNGDDGTCEESKYPIYATIAGYTSTKPFSESALETATANQGPISVAIDASHLNFQLYTSGIYQNSKCSQFLLDHAVTVVGYNNDYSGGEYWIVKNSWGTSWGQAGYIWMAKNDGNMCGIATEPAYPACGDISN